MRRPLLFAALVLALAAPALGAGPASAPARPTSWAQPVAAEGVKNLYKVTDGLYRGAQPGAKGMRALERLGIKTIVNLRGWFSDADEIEGTKLRLIEVGMSAGRVDEEKLIVVLRALNDPSGAPYFVHCWHGSDRTGLVVAVHRIVFEGWTRAAAIDELLHGGYGFHSMYDDIVEYLRGFDVGRLRARVLAAAG